MNKTFKAFFADLNSYPALAGAVSVLLALGATMHWQIAFLLAFWIYALSPILRKVSLIVCAAVLTSFFWQRDNFSFAENPPASGVGYVDEVLNRANGYGVILQTSFGKTRLNYAGEKVPMPGDSVFWKAKWYPVTPPTVPGAFNSPEWMRSEGLCATGSLDSVYVLSSEWTFQKISFLAKQKLQRRFEQFYVQPETALLMGLLIGDRSGISETLQSDFRKTGLVH
ncbi:MAG: DUF4131 domain-containing protein, partial [Fibromonadales bacterium]|nr:DUF4131 domain-containing protein [Fibromonadales bacterium]